MIIFRVHTVILSVYYQMFTRLNVKKQTNTCFILESVSLMPPFLKSQYWGKGCHYDTSSIYYMQHLILIYNPKGI